MSQPLAILSRDHSLWEAKTQMEQMQVRRLVVTEEKGALKGLVTQSSLLQALNLKEINAKN